MIKSYKIHKICFWTATFVIGTAISFAFLLDVKSAGAKQYWYDLIAVNIKINSDSTFDVEERQGFNFIGNFHAADRVIPLNKIDAITDIDVIDAETGKPLRHVSGSKRLNELDSSNWGSFVSFKENGMRIIDWYFNLSDTKHEWIIKYKVHGGIGFFRDYDELYWNLFDGYDVPILKVEARARLPEAANKNEVKADIYANTKNQLGQLKLVNNLPFTVFSKILDNKTFYFSAENIPPREPLTIYAGWPKEIVSQSAYWIGFLKIFWGYILGLFIIAASLVSGFWYWYFTEKHDVGRGTIIPQYEPPQNLRPAMAEVITKEKITGKAWPATIVDLAVRGYVKIKDDSAYWGDISSSVVPLFILVLVFAIAIFATMSFAGRVIFGVIFVFLLFNTKLIKSKGGLKESFAPKNYIIEKIKPFENDDNLESYEKKFLGKIFRNKNYFSTKELKSSSKMEKRKFADSINELKDDLLKETEKDTMAFEIGVSREKIRAVILAAAFFVCLFLLIFGVLDFSNQYHFLILSAATGSLGLFTFIKYEARLSKEGQILREDWLGFKLYLETAEKYRLQNLTPELFEKYLPYAMIFGIEKKWARAFESLNIRPPSWHESASVARGVGFGGVPSFSPSAFSSSFSSSFSSAFSSASGGHGGGGGSAGGGGGGGGGGAR